MSPTCQFLFPLTVTLTVESLETRTTLVFRIALCLVFVFVSPNILPKTETETDFGTEVKSVVMYSTP